MKAEFSRSSLRPADFPFLVVARVDVVKGCKKYKHTFNILILFSFQKLVAYISQH